MPPVNSPLVVLPVEPLGALVLSTVPPFILGATENVNDVSGLDAVTSKASVTS